MPRPALAQGAWERVPRSRERLWVRAPRQIGARPARWVGPRIVQRRAAPSWAEPAACQLPSSGLASQPLQLGLASQPLLGVCPHSTMCDNNCCTDAGSLMVYLERVGLARVLTRMPKPAGQ